MKELKVKGSEITIFDDKIGKDDPSSGYILFREKQRISGHR